MIARIVGGVALALSLAVGAAQAATVASPTPPNIFIDLTVSFSPTPPDVIPSGATLTGDAQFFDVVGTDRTFIVREGTFDIGSLTPGQSFSVYFLPPGPASARLRAASISVSAA